MSQTQTGETLADLLAKMGEKLVGRGRDTRRFPLLVKLIDARENLSVQVHPNDQTAPLLNAEAKSEMWVALKPSPVYAGFKSPLGLAQIRSSIQDQTLPNALRHQMLQRGESLYIPGGTIHAICAGSLLLEVQQNSNTTYRLFDWGRKGRPLHIEEGLSALTFKAPASPYFLVASQQVETRFHPRLDPTTFQVFFCEQGTGTVTCDGCIESFAAGETILITADSKELTLKGSLSLIQISLPPLAG
jgi:mannose-6-phosphate isomerase